MVMLSSAGSHMHAHAAAVSIPLTLAILAGYSHELKRFYLLLSPAGVRAGLQSEPHLLCLLVVACKFMQTAAALLVGFKLGGEAAAAAGAACLFSIPPFLVLHRQAVKAPATDTEGPSAASNGNMPSGSISPPSQLSLCGAASYSRVMQLGDLFRIHESNESTQSCKSGQSSTSGLGTQSDLLRGLGSASVSQLVQLARASLTLPVSRRGSVDTESRILMAAAAEGVEMDVQTLTLAKVLQLAATAAQRLPLLTAATGGEGSQRLSVSSADVAANDSNAAAAARSPPHSRRMSGESASPPANAEGGSTAEQPTSAGLWRETLEMLQSHSSEIAHDMKNPLNGILALSQVGGMSQSHIGCKVNIEGPIGCPQ